MQNRTKQIRTGGEAQVLERAIVSYAIAGQRRSRCSREELAAELGIAESDALANPLASLARDGVVDLDRKFVQASRATVRLDELGLIAL